MNAWYWRHRGDYANDCHWEFLCYGKPDIFWLQREYLEIRT